MTQKTEEEHPSYGVKCYVWIGESKPKYPRMMYSDGLGFFHETLADDKKDHKQHSIEEILMTAISIPKFEIIQETP